MSKKEQSTDLLGKMPQMGYPPSEEIDGQPDLSVVDGIPANSDQRQQGETYTDQTHFLHSNSAYNSKYMSLKPETSFRSFSSQSSSVKADLKASGRPTRHRVFSTLDLVAVVCSFICLIICVTVILPSLTLAWRMGFQSQIIAIGFLLGVMNICASRVVPSCLVAIEARYGASRLQNFDAIITNKFFSSHVALLWRGVIMLLLALPLGLSVGYKQFLGGESAAQLNHTVQSNYGISFPNIGDWAPIQDPIYLEFSADAAFHSASQNDSSVVLNSSNTYPIPYGFNILLLSADSVAILDLPTNEYLQDIRSRLAIGETWQLSASTYAYIASRDDETAESLRVDNQYWETILNASDRGLTSYYLAQDANSYMGLLAVVGQPFCWLGIFRGGPTTDSMYSKSLDDMNVIGFRKAAHLFSLSRRRCEATWAVTAASLAIKGGICANTTGVGINQEPVLGCRSCPWSINAGPGLPHIFWDFVSIRPNSTWLLARYAVTAATTYWARGVYMIHVNNFKGFNYSGIDEYVLSTRSTLDAAPLLFACLAVQPMLTLLAFILIIRLSVPISGNFGLVAVLAGVKRSTLDLLDGAAFSGQLRRPIKLEIIVTDRPNGELAGTHVAAIRYDLKPETSTRSKLSKASRHTMYL